MKKHICAVLVFIVVFSLAVPAFAQENKTIPAPPAAPATPEPPAPVDPIIAPVVIKGVPVLVEHTGNDEIGGTLALKLKEKFRKSVLFSLTDKDSKAIRIRVTSRSEFVERPEIGSVYTVVWIFAESSEVVPFFLKEELGLVNSGSIESAAAKLMNKTDKIADQYKYLFE